MMKELPSDPVIALSYRLHKLVYVMDKVADSLLQKQLDIGFSQFMILMALSRETEITQKNLTQFLNMTPGAISRQVDQMHRKGLITREVNAENRREHMVALTEEGSSTLEEAYDILKRFMGDVYRPIDGDRAQALSHTLDTLITRLFETREVRNVCNIDETISNHS
jgi:DNA-binding MarR family transcriptional regulator